MRCTIILATLFVLAPVAASDLDDLDWLEGCWQSPGGGSTEVWVRDRDGSLLGFSVDMSGDGVAYYELLRVSTNADGVPVYAAFPKNQAPTVFTLIDSGDRNATFANPAHDFPQRIRYRRDGNRLLAEISAMDGGGERRFDKVSCEAD